MNAALEPTFPALLVHADDGSITVVSSLAEWSCDPDLWWIAPSDFMVDHHGRRFDLTLTPDPKVNCPPTWHPTHEVAPSDLRTLVLRHLASERIDAAHFQAAVAGISEEQLVAFVFDYLSSFDAPQPGQCPAPAEKWGSVTLMGGAWVLFALWIYVAGSHCLNVILTASSTASSLAHWWQLIEFVDPWWPFTAVPLLFSTIMLRLCSIQLCRYFRGQPNNGRSTGEEP